MNILVGSVFLLFLLFPGLAFRYFLIRGPNRKVNISNIEQVYWSIIPAFLIHLFWVLIIESFEKLPDPDYLLIKNVIYGAIDSGNVDIIKSSSLWFFSFYLATFLSGIALGYIFRSVIIKYGLHNLHPMFLVDDRWTIQLRAEYISHDYEFDSDTGFIQADCLVNGGEKQLILYSGIVNMFDLTKEGNLANIYLVDAMRRNYNADLPIDDNKPRQQQIDDRYYQIPGDVLIITAQNLININLTYLEYEIDKN